MVNMAETEPMFLVGGRLQMNGAETASEDSEGEAPILFTQPKRNKRKNFDPMNIVYQKEEEEYCALDLSSSDASEAKRPRRSDEDSAPMDLSKGREKESPTESDSSDGESRPPYLQAFLHQATDASDLRDYAQKTVKELLEIYGLNSPEVAESITNNVPISNFSSGKILESLRRGPTGPRSPGASQPPTPPRSPLSPAKLKSSDQTPQQSKSQSTPQQSNNFTAPRMVLPQNMATILAFAAMQDRQGPPTSSASCQSSKDPISAAQTQLAQVAANAGVVRGDTKTITQMDYSRYVRRFASSLECGNQYCKELNYREHFHCLDCNSRTFVKKEEMIRHFKWHKKRDESLQHGFMRYSPSDDCSDRYPNCGHNRKQTHYHCIQGTCDKVYISTSDVQMHANYHRKDSAIIQEGFQRLRATEECRTPYCAFFGQRTTHFHCRRDHCQFTFKNKADMEKHKTYHIKDEALARDGFKKFLKPDPCGFANCRFSQVCNHIHCVREGCSYVLHSSGQLLSHKRKHERKDSEIAYRKFKLAQQAVVNIGAPSEQPLQHSDIPAGSSLQLLQQASSLAALNALSENFTTSTSSEKSQSPSLPSTPSSHFNKPPTSGASTPSFLDQSTSSQDYDDEFTRYIASFSPTQSCGQPCQLSGTEHYHCRESSCELPFRCRETAEGHARMHEAQERVSDFFQEGSPLCHSSCPAEKHYHCTWEGCCDIVMPSERLEHFRSHEISAQHNNSLDTLFRRKRGRPPKNRVIEVWNDYASGSGSDSPQAIFTSFKLPKPSPATPTSEVPTMLSSPLTITTVSEPKSMSNQNIETQGFQSYNGPCPDPLCLYSNRQQHYHCSRPRCFFATDSDDFLIAHTRDFHDNIDILEGFLFFDRSVDCRIESCTSNKINRHFHCVRAGCGYSFVRYSHMAIHQAEHESERSQSHSPCGQATDLSDSSEKPDIKPDISKLNNENFNQHVKQEENSINNMSRPTVVKASGTFYPLCGLSNCNSSPTPPSETGHNIKIEPGTTNSEQSIPEWISSVEKHDRYAAEGYSEMERLKPHIAKHNPSVIAPTIVKSENNNNEDNNQQPHHGLSMMPLPMESQESNMMPPPHFPGFLAAVANQQLAMITSQGIPFMPHAMPGLYTSPSGLMFTGPPGFAPHPSTLVNNGLLESARASLMNSDTTPEALLARSHISPQRDMSTEAKKARVQTTMRMLKDEPVPDGYLRFKFNEDCRYSHCGYREHQTHFHCMRQDCGYSFCDKTRFVQHTARHERLDTLMGGDFQQYRANVSCGRPDCSYTPTIGSVQNKASHFHCLKCDFVCSDTNKVVAHRRQHQKLDSIMAAGFEKFTPSQSCSTPDTCAHNGKQTHYHCLSCQYAVLGLSQMTAHKYRHMD
ncbi:zinc finger protein castor homolog 1 [Halyomorpha halys]|uniref:zinc finger protein castor homolog 1 n=1 Tax=Halyomorpha halys TaxID=286706 RepID=UPI0006D4D112